MVGAMDFRVRSRFHLNMMIWNWLVVSNVWIRDALQEMMNYWNSGFDMAEEMDTDF